MNTMQRNSLALSSEGYGRDCVAGWVAGLSGCGELSMHKPSSYL
ncbi:MAG: hypothetical protein Q7T96_08380 [Methylobacter sp.]|nr:hypothetical protein [Methylobacter sp.]